VGSACFLLFRFAPGVNCRSLKQAVDKLVGRTHQALVSTSPLGVMRYYRHNAAPLVPSFNSDSLRPTLIEAVGAVNLKGFM
jgi:hypothetical protein